LYYELYIDVIFSVNFFVNAFVLHMLNHSYHKTATNVRVIVSSLIGTLLYCICLLCPIGTFGIRNIIGGMVSGVVMLLYCFPIRSFSFLTEVLAKTGGYYFLFGGMWMIMRRWDLPMIAQIGILGMTAGAISVWKKNQKKEGGIFSVSIQNKEIQMSITAFLDTGNHLYEPISGKPVCVVSKECLEQVYGKNIPDLFRVIPFRSVGKGHGIMKGYLIENMIINSKGMEKSYQNVYVCVSEEITFDSRGYQMILHSDMM